MRRLQMSRRGAVLAAVGALLLTAPAELAGQSLFGSRGLGVVVSPAGARGAALGGLGIALPGPSPSLLNPADAAEVYRRGALVALQPSTTELEVQGGTGNVDATRFPLVQLHLPFGSDLVLSVGYGAMLDQNWGVVSRSTEVLGSDTVNAVDRIVSEGGIAQGRLNLAYRLTETLTIGAGLGLLTGSTRREATREFVEVSAGLDRFSEVEETGYNAPLASVGVRWHLGDVRLAGALTWIGDLTIDDEDDDREVSMPLEAVGGASVALMDDLLLAVSGRWMRWSAGEVFETPADDGFELGGGLEWSGITSRSRIFPVRLGARWGQQPFTFGDAAPHEAALTAGAGALLAGTRETPAALVDVTLERGERGDLGENGLAESFWRATVSISLFVQ